MSKKKEFIVPVYYKIKAESYEDALELLTDYIVLGTGDTLTEKGLKDWSHYIGDLQ